MESAFACTAPRAKKAPMNTAVMVSVILFIAKTSRNILEFRLAPLMGAKILQVTPIDTA
jgi:hypothetical protein